MNQPLTLPPELAGVPRDADGPVFKAPWEAQAFAMTLALYERGVFTWTEWAATLATRIARAQAQGDADLGDTYYTHWLGALEDIVGGKGVASAGELERYQHAWDHAAQRTPHGEPIELRDADLHGH
ncbi:MAG: nitrile hydratase accessory protein [Ramlibacter sp.]|jgi:nitrile hydratase accessory protein|nr:nitrile hydratase accessory protein [Ramlibacter sp.]